MFLENLPCIDLDMSCKHFLHQSHHENMERIFDQESRGASNFLLRYIVIDILFHHNLEHSKKWNIISNYKKNVGNLKIPFLEYQSYPHIVYEVYIFSSLVVLLAQVFVHRHLNHFDLCLDAVPLDVAVTDCLNAEVGPSEDMVVAVGGLNE